MRLKFKFCKLVFVLLLAPGVQAATCTYQTWDWDSVQRKAVNIRKVSKPKSELTREELGDVPGCSVCEEDQVELRLPQLAPFKVCKSYESKVRRAIESALNEGFPISNVVGYRVGKTKGPLSPTGQRTQFSNHSFGVAIDINSEKNGLYDHCIQFGPHCKLIRGGDYRPGAPGSIEKSSSVYRAMKDEGLKWGGEIQGKQKDFMHFSPTGM